MVGKWLRWSKASYADGLSFASEALLGACRTLPRDSSGFTVTICIQLRRMNLHLFDV
jgi:hypothetical protein